jgi:hypothetical protein
MVAVFFDQVSIVCGVVPSLFCVFEFVAFRGGVFGVVCGDVPIISLKFKIQNPIETESQSSCTLHGKTFNDR